jgi:hypothetical protein
MTHTVYMSQIRRAFLQAHTAIWEDLETTSMEITDQKRLWQEKHHAKIFGGPFDDHGISVRDIGLEFESESDYVLFMLEWS